MCLHGAWRGVCVLFVCCARAMRGLCAGYARAVFNVMRVEHCIAHAAHRCCLFAGALCGFDVARCHPGATRVFCSELHGTAMRAK